MRESLGIVLSKIEKAVKHLSNPGLKFPFKRLPKQYALANLKIDTCVSYYRNFIVQQKKKPKKTQKPKNLQLPCSRKIPNQTVLFFSQRPESLYIPGL